MKDTNKKLIAGIPSTTNEGGEMATEYTAEHTEAPIAIDYILAARPEAGKLEPMTITDLVQSLAGAAEAANDLGKENAKNKVDNNKANNEINKDTTYVKTGKTYYENNKPVRTESLMRYGNDTIIVTKVLNEND